MLPQRQIIFFLFLNSSSKKLLSMDVCLDVGQQSSIRNSNAYNNDQWKTMWYLLFKLRIILDDISYIKGNVWESWRIKGGLDWVKTRCLVITIYFKTPKNFENPWKLHYRQKLKRYLGREGRVFRRYLGQDGRVFGGISAGTEVFFRYLGRDGIVQNFTFFTFNTLHIITETVVVKWELSD